MVYISAVSNATPLIYLAKASYLDILRKTYGQIYVCSEVWMEVIRPILHAKPIPKDVPIMLYAKEKGCVSQGCPLEIYLNDPAKVAEKELLTEIQVPIKKK